ncbi:MAG: rRNA maturation RNase YbeY [Verrucomicrobiota bacterium]
MKQLVLRNRQRKHPLNLRLFRRVARVLLEEILELDSYELGLQLVRAAEMARVNEQFLYHTGSTDVITFDYSAEAEPGKRPSPARRAIHGDLFICIDDAIAQARVFKTTWPEEVVRYFVHGVLHLLGHDDLRPEPRRRMKREEDRLTRMLARRFALSELERKPKVGA